MAEAFREYQDCYPLLMQFWFWLCLIIFPCVACVSIGRWDDGEAMLMGCSVALMLFGWFLTGIWIVSGLFA